MSIDFAAATPAEFMENFRRLFEQIENLAPDDQAIRPDLFASAMLALIGLKVHEVSDPDAPWVTRELPEFRRNARDRLARQGGLLSRYLAGLETALWERTLEGWYRACVRRTAAQIISDDIDHGLDIPLIERHRLDEDDDEMREMGAEIEPLPTALIPPGMPSHHWWWTLPATAGD